MDLSAAAWEAVSRPASSEFTRPHSQPAPSFSGSLNLGPLPQSSSIGLGLGGAGESGLGFGGAGASGAALGSAFSAPASAPTSRPASTFGVEPPTSRPPSTIGGLGGIGGSVAASALAPSASASAPASRPASTYGAEPPTSHAPSTIGGSILGFGAGGIAGPLGRSAWEALATATGASASSHSPLRTGAGSMAAAALAPAAAAPSQPASSLLGLGGSRGLGGGLGLGPAWGSGAAGETAQQLAHGLSSSMQRALGSLGSTSGAGPSGVPTVAEEMARIASLGAGSRATALGHSPLRPDLQFRAPILSPHRDASSLLHSVPPWPTAGHPPASQGLPPSLVYHNSAPVMAADATAKGTIHVDVALRPGDTIEISSPPASPFRGKSVLGGSFSQGVLRDDRPRALVGFVPPPRDAGTVSSTGEAERRRIEIASLRQEVGSLLQMNSSLHARLNTANTVDLNSTGESFMRLDGSAEPKAPLAWLEERKSLEKRAAQLTEDCCALEREKTALEASSAGFAAADPPSLAGLVREKEDLRQRLHATELARAAAEHRVATAHAALARSQEELGMRKQRHHGAQEEARFGPWLAEEVKSLQRELSQEHAKLNDVGLALARKNELVARADREQSEARAEYDALVLANESLQKEITTMKEKVELDRQGTRTAETELGELQVQYRLTESSLNNELQEAKVRAQTAEASLQGRRHDLQSSEANTAAAKAEGLELQGQLEVLRAAHSELMAQEEGEVAEHNDQVLLLRARMESVSADKAELEKHFEEVESATRELQARDLECEKQQEITSRELENLRARGTDMARRSQDAMTQAEQRIQALLQQLNDERQQNLELEREISIAREAAGEVSSAPWEIAREKAAGKPKGWASTALQMHREMELLTRWKTEALDTFNRMQVDLGAAQQQYQGQLHHNQRMQERLEQMGHQAKSTVAGFSLRAPTESAFSAVPLPLPDTSVHPPGTGQAGDTVLRPPSLACTTSPPGYATWLAAGEAALFEPGSLPMGPDVPERPDLPLPAQMRASDLRPTSSGAYNFATFGPVTVPTAVNGVAPGGPVSGPFYEAFRTRAGPGAPRLAAHTAPRLTAQAEPGGGARRRRPGSAGRSSSTPVVAPLLAGGVNRPLSAGAGTRRR